MPNTLQPLGMPPPDNTLTRLERFKMAAELYDLLTVRSDRRMQLTLASLFVGSGAYMVAQVDRLTAGWQPRSRFAAQLLVGPLLGQPAIEQALATDVDAWLRMEQALTAAAVRFVARHDVGPGVTLGIGLHLDAIWPFDVSIDKRAGDALTHVFFAYFELLGFLRNVRVHARWPGTYRPQFAKDPTLRRLYRITHRYIDGVYWNQRPHALGLLHEAIIRILRTEAIPIWGELEARLLGVIINLANMKYRSDKRLVSPRTLQRYDHEGDRIPDDTQDDAGCICDPVYRQFPNELDNAISAREIFQRLRDDLRSSGHTNVLRGLEALLTKERDGLSYAEAAVLYDMSRQTLHDYKVFIGARLTSLFARDTKR